MCFPSPLAPSPPKKPSTLRKNHLCLFVLVILRETGPSYSIYMADQYWSMNGRQAAFLILCSPRLWIYDTTASIFKMGLGGKCALVCVTLSHVIITLGALYLIKKGCVLCRCWQELGRKCCVHRVKRECPASFHLQSELPKNETQEYCRCNLIFPQRFLVHWYRKLELLSNDLLFLRVGMAIKVLVFWLLHLFVKKLEWVEGKSRKGKTIGLNFSEHICVDKR